MPSFTTQSPNLVGAGPLVEVAVGPTQALVDSLKSKGVDIPKTVKAIAMIDTGATGTVISPAVTGALGIRPVGVTQMSTPSTNKPVDVLQYNIRLLFPNGVSVENIVAIQAPLAGQHIQCLVGRDVLRHGVFVYIGYANQFTLSF
jgi:predicted aspartyl protease